MESASCLAVFCAFCLRFIYRNFIPEILGPYEKRLSTFFSVPLSNVRILIFVNSNILPLYEKVVPKRTVVVLWFQTAGVCGCVRGPGGVSSILRFM